MACFYSVSLPSICLCFFYFCLFFGGVSFLRACVCVCVCVSLLYVVHLGDFTFLVFRLALYLNCLLLDFIQYFYIIEKAGNISFICTICHFNQKPMYVCTHRPPTLLYKNFCKIDSRNGISGSKSYVPF